MKPRSLWLHPVPGIVVSLARWRDYPYFWDALSLYMDPEALGVLPVAWEAYGDFTRYVPDTDDWRSFVRGVAGRMRAGADVPPLVRWADGTRMDGVHRAFAARSLGLRRAPTVTLPRH